MVAIWGRLGPLLGGRLIEPVRRSRHLRYNVHFTKMGCIKGRPSLTREPGGGPLLGAAHSQRDS
ncbi:unnamed protein product, partial [marine sediment metagenome]